MTAADRPLLSVLMPSFNSERFIGEAVASALALGDDIEIVIQDGGSNDGTAAVIERLADPRIKFRSEPDLGQSDALNRALARARGQWIGWLNSDDVYISDGSSKLGTLLDSSHDFVYGDMDTIDAAGARIKHYRASRPFTLRNLLRYGCFINCSAGFYRAETLRAAGGLDPSLHYVMDYELLLRLAARGVRTRYVPVDVMSLRRHEATKTTQGHASPAFLQEAREIQRPYVDQVPGGRLLAWTGVAIFRLYIHTMPLWRTSLWRRIRPSKRL